MPDEISNQNIVKDRLKKKKDVLLFYLLRLPNNNTICRLPHQAVKC